MISLLQQYHSPRRQSNTDNTPTFTGTATDVSSTISSVDYQIDGGIWTPATANDGTFTSSK